MSRKRPRGAANAEPISRSTAFRWRGVVAWQPPKGAPYVIVRAVGTILHAHFVAWLPGATLLGLFAAGCTMSVPEAPFPNPACNRAEIPGRASETCDSVNQARNQWRSHAVTDYRYTLQQACFCPWVSAIVTVRDGEVQSVVPVDGGVTLERGYTVEGLFSLIEKYIGENAYSIGVRYHASWGHPTSISVDLHGPGTADDELSISASDLSPLP